MSPPYNCIISSIYHNHLTYHSARLSTNKYRYLLTARTGGGPGSRTLSYWSTAKCSTGMSFLYKIPVDNMQLVAILYCGHNLSKVFSGFLLVKSSVMLRRKEMTNFVLIAVLRIRIQDPGSGAFLTPWSGIRNRFFPDPGSQIYIFESLVTICWVKSSIIL